MSVRGFGIVWGLCAVAMLGCGDESTNPAPTPDPAQLEPPPKGQGFQMQTDDIEVASGAEVQDCYFFKVSELAAAGGLPSDKPVNLHRIQIAQTDGSHHMNIFRVKTPVNLVPENGRVQKGLNGDGECFKSPNWADWPIVANSQQDGQRDWTYPDGVANVFQPDEWLMLQTHYVNATTQKTPTEIGHVSVNFWHIPTEQVKDELGTLFKTTQSIRICESNPTPTFSSSCGFNSPNPVNVIGANGHFHSRGRDFQMFAWDGKTAETPPMSDRFYESTQWADPPMLTSPELDVKIPAMGGVFYTCSYQWAAPPPAIGCKTLDAYDAMKNMTTPDDLDCCYAFGPIVDKNEHCNIFVYYYPKQDNIVCQ